MTWETVSDTLDAIVGELHFVPLVTSRYVIGKPEVTTALTPRGEELLRELRLAVHREVLNQQPRRCEQCGASLPPATAQWHDRRWLCGACKGRDVASRVGEQGQ
jgi:ribosomal protein S27AE